MEFVITEGEGKSRMRISGRLDTSSSGLRCFLFLLKSAQESKHTVTLVNMTAPIKEVFDITGFSSMFAIE